MAEAPPGGEDWNPPPPSMMHLGGLRWSHAFHSLYAQVPEEEIPQYTKGAHMRGPDVRIYERTRAEMVSLGGSLLVWQQPASVS